MSTPLRRSALLVLVLAFAAFPALAAKYTVELHNGTKLETLYQPKEASWDRDMVLVLSDAGNWLAVPRGDIAGITAKLQQQGFGKILDEKTVQIGYTANDAPTDEELEALDNDENAILRDFLDTFSQPTEQQDFSVDQFVSPEAAGTGGLPAGYGSSGGFSIGSDDGD